MRSFKSIFQKSVFVAFFFMSTGNFIFAQEHQALAAAQGLENKIKFAGADGDMLVFEVQLYNLPAKGTTLSILDEQGNTIFGERIFASTHTRRYKIARNDMRLITFNVSGKTYSFNQSFSINYRVEEKLEVKKVK